MLQENQQQAIVRQNQSSNVRDFLIAKGWIDYLNTYEYMIAVELFKDFCLNGMTDDIKTRVKRFDTAVANRIKENVL